MANRGDRGEYFAAEAEFFAKTIDLKAVVEDHGYKYSRQSSSRSQPIYIRGDRVITVTLGTKRGIWIWCDLAHQEDNGTLKEFLMMEHLCDDHSAYDRMREIANARYGVDYQMFKDGFAKLQVTGQLPRKMKESSGVQRNSRIKQFNPDNYVKEHGAAIVKEFSFEKAVSLDFFLNRGITQETLDHPLFQGRFGNAQGAFGDTEIRAGRHKPSDFEFPVHIIIPYWDLHNRVIAIEAKNRLTQDAYEKQIAREINAGGNPRRVRRNPSKYYPDSTKQGAWISNIPEEPLAIHLCEHPANSMAYFQLHKDDPLAHRTIYMGTGGPVVDGHYAILHKLIKEHGIKTIIPAFDLDLGGLKYTLGIIQNLPFNEPAKQVYDVSFRPSARYELEIDFFLRNELLSIKPEQILTELDKIKRALKNRFQFEGGFEIYPALTIRDLIVTVSIPFTPKNAYEIIRLSQILLKTAPDVFQIRFPTSANDWNDELQGIRMPEITPTHLLFDQPENRNRLFITQNNAVLFHQRFTSFDHNVKETVGEIFPFAQKYFVKPAATIIRHEFLMRALETAQKEYQSYVPLLKQEFVSHAVRQGIVFTPMTQEFVQADMPIAKWNVDEGAYTALKELNAQQQKALDWMREAMRSGKDPHTPEISLNYNEVLYKDELIGRISPWFTFQEAKNFSIEKMDRSGRDQLELLMMGFSQVSEKWEAFREKYPEPIMYYSSENLILEENKVPLFKFIPESSQLQLISDPSKILMRNFNPFFYKALQLFIENQGVFYNYIRLMRVDREKGTIFYNSPDHEIGRLLVEGEKTYYAVYPNIPESMKREMRVLSPFPEAPEELIKSRNVVLEPTGLNAKITENAISRIPFAFLRFYDNRARKFNSLPDDKLKRLPPSSQQLYTEAFLWHLNNVGPAIEAIGTEKEKFYEKDGYVFFNRIAVARYNTEKDILDVLTPPSTKYLQHIAIFERNLVKNPANRVYADFLLSAENDSSQQKPLVNAGIVAILDKIELSEANRLQIVDKAFKLKEIGYIEGNRMVLNEAYMRYSDTFREALSFYAEAKGHLLEWKNLDEEAEAIKTNLSSIEIPEKGKIYEHQLLTTSTGVLKGIVDAPVFEGKVSINDQGELNFHFLPNKDGQLKMPYGSDWDRIEKAHYWMSKQVEKPSTLILASSPEQAIHYHQYNLPESLYEREMYLSVIKGEDKDTKVLVEKLVAAHNIRELRIIGDENFVNRFQTAFAKFTQVSVFPVPILTAEHGIVKFRKFISPFEPNAGLQPVLEGISGHSLLNPATGIVVFPMRSESSNSRAILGSQLFISKDADALWISRPMKSSTGIVLLANPEEALYYMNMNKEYLRNVAVIAFQNKVTESQVRFLVNNLKIPRFHNKITVGNTMRLSEQLLDFEFKLPSQIEKPLRETTFRQEFLSMTDEYKRIKKDIQLSRRRVSYDLGKTVGKHNAPALTSTFQVQGQGLKDQKSM